MPREIRRAVRLFESSVFDYEGVRRQGIALPDGTIADEHLYALLSPNPLPPLEVTWG